MEEKMAKNIAEFFKTPKNLEMIDKMISKGVKITNKYQTTKLFNIFY